MAKKKSKTPPVEPAKPAAPAEAAKPAAKKTTIAKVKSAVVHAAEEVADAVSHAATSAKKHVITPVAEAVGIVEKPKEKKKKERPVRTKVEKPAIKATPAEPRKKTASGMMMSKNLSLLPDEKPGLGTKPKAKGKIK